MYGWIHKLEKVYKHELASVIILICVLFYENGCDEWDPKHICNSMELSDRHRTISQKEEFEISSSYYKCIVESGTFALKFKIEKTRRGMIEISKVKDAEPPPYTYCTEGAERYGFLPFHADLIDDSGISRKYEKYGVKCKTGDIVEMILVLDELSLSYKINDVDYGKHIPFKMQI